MNEKLLILFFVDNQIFYDEKELRNRCANESPIAPAPTMRSLGVCILIFENQKF